MMGIESIQAAKAGLPTLVMLHGWGYHRHAWPQPLLEALSQIYQVVLVDLPSHGDSVGLTGEDEALEQLDTWLTELSGALPEQFALLGWSLGGQVALRFAHQYPQRVTSLVVVASNLSFVQRPDWLHAMGAATLESFRSAYGRMPGKTLQRFCALQSQGGQRTEMLKLLRGQIQENASAGQQTGLYWLQNLDGRAAWQGLGCPGLAIMAEADALVPVAVADDMLALNHANQVRLLPGCHALPFDTDLVPELVAFWEAIDE